MKWRTKNLGKLVEGICAESIPQGAHIMFYLLKNWERVVGDMAKHSRPLSLRKVAKNDNSMTLLIAVDHPSAALGVQVKENFILEMVAATTGFRMIKKIRVKYAKFSVPAKLKPLPILPPQMHKLSATAQKHLDEVIAAGGSAELIEILNSLRTLYFR